MSHCAAAALIFVWLHFNSTVSARGSLLLRLYLSSVPVSRTSLENPTLLFNHGFTGTLIYDRIPVIWNQSSHHVDAAASVSRMTPDMLLQPF